MIFLFQFFKFKKYKNTKYKIQNTKYKIQNTKYKIQKYVFLLKPLLELQRKKIQDFLVFHLSWIFLVYFYFTIVSVSLVLFVILYF